MLDYAALQSGLLPPTATYPSRAWGWIPAINACNALGRLVLECDYANGEREERRYMVEEMGALPGLMGRRFKLVRDHGDPYVVTLGAMPSCTCTAGQCRAKFGVEACKHLAALDAIARKGLLLDELADNERSGLAFEDRPGEPTVAELVAAKL
jgi:hypothetical protein